LESKKIFWTPENKAIIVEFKSAWLILGSKGLSGTVARFVEGTSVNKGDERKEAEHLPSPFQ
jgi:hypothetical protein